MAELRLSFATLLLWIRCPGQKTLLIMGTKRTACFSLRSTQQFPCRPTELFKQDNHSLSQETGVTPAS